MIKLIDLYILKRFIGRLIFLLIAISSIILITNLVEMIDNFIDAEMNSNEIFYYYLYTLPMIISYALPMAITIATVLSILAYIKNNELLAIRSLGINIDLDTEEVIFNQDTNDLNFVVPVYILFEDPIEDEEMLFTWNVTATDDSEFEYSTECLESFTFSLYYVCIISISLSF